LIGKSDLPVRAWLDLNDYVESVGTAASRDELLNRVLSELLRLVPFDTECGFFEVSGPCLRAIGAGDARIQAYSEYYRFRMPLLSAEGTLRPELRGVTVTDWRTQPDSEFARDFMFPGESYQTLSCTLPGDRYVIALHRSRLAPAFTDLECALLSVAAPHVRNLYARWETGGELGDHRRADRIAGEFRELSRRECEVAALLCRGLASAEIAALLLISRRTVEAHTAHLYGKLNVHSRAAARRMLLRGERGA
jgi:DNA-binding CsgD family transcriptional regulator